MHHHHGRDAEHFRWTFEPCPITPLQLKLVQFRSFPARKKTSLLHKKQTSLSPRGEMQEAGERTLKTNWLENALARKRRGKEEEKDPARKKKCGENKTTARRRDQTEEERFSLARSLDPARKTNTNRALKEEEQQQERTFVLTRELRFREWTWPDVATAAAVHIHSVLLFSVVLFFFFFFFCFLLLFPPGASKT